MTSVNSHLSKTRYITGCSLLIALAVILQYVEFAIPLMPSFIKFDFSDLPALIGVGIILILLCVPFWAWLALIGGALILLGLLLIRK